MPAHSGRLRLGVKSGLAGHMYNAEYGKLRSTAAESNSDPTRNLNPVRNAILTQTLTLT